MSDNSRIDVGFQGGQMLALRAPEGAREALVKALADEKADRWHTLETDEEDVLIDLSQVVYVRRESTGKTVGF